MRCRAGFTLLEVLVALVVFAVGVLGLTAEAAALTRALGRVRRAEAVMAAAQARLERLRARACSDRVDGSEAVTQGATAIADLRWSWSDAGDSTFALRLALVPAAAPIRPIRPETLLAVLSCR
jgi:general secretion pathway protein I